MNKAFRHFEFIELSLVFNPPDPRAVIKDVVYEKRRYVICG